MQFPECVHQCADDSNPVCSVCHKKLYTKITAKAADGTTKTAYFTEDSALENGYVEAIQTLNGWSNEGCTEPTLTLLRDSTFLIFRFHRLSIFFSYLPCLTPVLYIISN